MTTTSITTKSRPALLDLSDIAGHPKPPPIRLLWPMFTVVALVAYPLYSHVPELLSGTSGWPSVEMSYDQYIKFILLAVLGSLVVSVVVSTFVGDFLYDPGFNEDIGTRRIIDRFAASGVTIDDREARRVLVAFKEPEGHDGAVVGAKRDGETVRFLVFPHERAVAELP